MKKSVFRLFHLSILIICFAAFSSNAQTAMTSVSTTEQMLNVMAGVFQHKINDRYALNVQINIQPALESGYVDQKKPARESWSVAVTPSKKIQLMRGRNDKAVITFYTTEIGLRLMFEGKFNPTTASLQTHGGDPLFLSFPRTKETEQNTEMLGRIQIFKHFFNPTLPDKFVLDVANSRMAHGARAVGLYYYPGLRSAWHLLEKGGKLNKPGDTRSYHQAFIFISGNGMGKIGDKTVKVKAGESYYVPPGSDNVFWNEENEPLVFIWMGWGNGA